MRETVRESSWIVAQMLECDTFRPTDKESSLAYSGEPSNQRRKNQIAEIFGALAANVGTFAANRYHPPHWIQAI